MNDSDRKLIEEVAVLNGFQVKGWIGDKLNYFDPINEHEGFGDWNPLENNADAFSLMCNFGLFASNSNDETHIRKLILHRIIGI